MIAHTIWLIYIPMIGKTTFFLIEVKLLGVRV